MGWEGREGERDRLLDVGGAGSRLHAKCFVVVGVIVAEGAAGVEGCRWS